MLEHRLRACGRVAQVAYRVLAVLLAVKDGENEAHGTLEPLPLLAVSAAFGCKFLGHRWEGAQPSS